MVRNKSGSAEVVSWIWIFIGLVTLFSAQLMRVLLPSYVYYLRDSKGFQSLTLAPIAVVTFGLGLTALLFIRFFGMKRALAVTALGVAVFRIAEQVSTIPGLDFYLSSAGVVLFLAFLPIAVSDARRLGGQATTQVGFGLLLGVTGDTALSLIFMTMDLSWIPGFWPLMVVVTLAIILILALRAHQRLKPTLENGLNQGSRNWTIAAFGPWFFLQFLIYQNPARLAAYSGWSLPVAGGIVILSAVLGMFLAGWRIGRRPRPILGAAAALGLGLLLVLPPSSGAVEGLKFLLGSLIVSVVLIRIMSSLGLGGESTGYGRIVLGSTLGQILFVVLMFLYYVSYDLSLGFRSSAIPPVAAFLLAIGVIGAAESNTRSPGWASVFRPALWAVLLLISPIVLQANWKEPRPVEPDPQNDTIRVMTYNLHQGFNTSGGLDIEAMAQIIENSQADVVALQEISRGYVINGSLDMLSWLSQRLEMPYISGPTSDPQWGNAILSRYPILRSDNHSLSPDSLRLRRGFIDAEIDIGAVNFRMLATHLHHVGKDSSIRQQQVGELLVAWGQTTRTVLLGDLNATPDAPEMQMLAADGLVEVAASLGILPAYTYYSANPERQIDYIWISPELTPTDFAIPQSTASDHLPVVVTLEIP